MVQKSAMQRLCKSEKHFLLFKTSQTHHIGAGRHTKTACDTQMELHALSRMVQGRSTAPQAVPDEVWSWALGTDSGHRLVAREAHSAVERTNTKADWPAVFGRWACLARCCSLLTALFSWMTAAVLQHIPGCRLTLTASGQTMQSALT